jgi:homoserine O-acetyltransferase
MTSVESGTRHLGSFTFECGESIDDLRVAYEAYGDFEATEEGSNAVLICHALTGSQNVASAGVAETAGQARAWWNDIVGPGKAIDTTEYYVVCANVPGSCYGSSGPPAENPETGEPRGTDFPPVTVGD